MTRVGRALLVPIAMVALLALPTVASPTPASAQAAIPTALPTCGASGNWFAGRNTPVAATIGTMADVTVRFGALCQSDPRPAYNFSTAWVMLAAGSGGYSQSGYIRLFAGSTRQFAEYDRDGVGPLPFTRVYGPATSLGTTHSYWVYYSSACACLNNNVDFTTLSATPFDPFAEWSSVFSVWSSETIYRESDVPGLASQPVNYGDLRVQPFGTSGYVQNPFGSVISAPTSPRYSVSGIAWNSFNAWTNAP